MVRRIVHSKMDEEKTNYGQKQVRELKEGEEELAVIRYCLGMVITPWRIPTFARKLINKQTLMQKDIDLLENNRKYSLHAGLGMLVGAASLIAADITHKPDYGQMINDVRYGIIALPIITNAFSLAYEIIRLPKSIKERKNQGNLENSLSN